MHASSPTFSPPCRKYFNESVQGVTDEVVSSTVEMYNCIREELLPTPSKSHYTFNLRDLSKVGARSGSWLMQKRLEKCKNPRHQHFNQIG